MNKILRPTIVLFVALTVVTGVAYPLAVTGIAKAVFPAQAAGSLIEAGGKTVGSALIGQNFSDPKNFWGRPSATSPMANNAANSSGSNQGPLNPNPRRSLYHCPLNPNPRRRLYLPQRPPDRPKEKAKRKARRRFCESPARTPSANSVCISGRAEIRILVGAPPLRRTIRSRTRPGMWSAAASSFLPAPPPSISR